MNSLVKCASCGKKPTVKSNDERGSWTAVCNPPMNTGGGPRYDADDGAANSAFTSGLRAEGAQESDSAAQRRASVAETSPEAARPESRGAGSRRRGPERFFYDKSSYTGTHINGGPERVAKGGGTAADQTWKRPTEETPGAAADTGVDADAGSRKRGPERFFYDKSSYTGTHVNGGPERVAKGGGTASDQGWKRPTGPTLLQTGEKQEKIHPLHRPFEEKASMSRTGSRGFITKTATTLAVTRPNSRGGVSASPARPSSSSRGAEVAVVRPSSRGGTAQRPTSRPPGEIRGPERFFYDKGSYTGTHIRGGPASVAKGGGTSADQSWKRQ